MERLTKRFDGWVMREGCHGPCRTCNGAKCADLYPVIDRLAAYEDSGLTPDEVAEYQHLCETYVEAGLDYKFVQICIDATKRGVTIEQIMELGSSNDPLTLDELREMDGEPVWVVPLNDFEILPANYLVNAYAEQIVVDKFGAYLDFEDYGKTWLAYRRRPEEGTT